MQVAASSMSRCFYRKSTSKSTISPTVLSDGKRMVKISENDYNNMMRLKYRKRNAAVGLLLFTGVFSVYFYSMFAINQEPLDKILDVTK